MADLRRLSVIAERLAKDVSLEPRPLDPKIIEAAERMLGIHVALDQTNSRRAHKPPEAK